MRAPVLLLVLLAAVSAAAVPSCQQAQVGQFDCASLQVDPSNGGHPTCLPDKTTTVNCSVYDGVVCDGERTFNVTVPCRYVGDKSYSNALSLSVFLGIFGADRFYLGYPTVGVLKLATLGFFFLGYYADVFMIAMQVLQPADGTDYVIPSSGPVLHHVVFSNLTLLS